MNPPVKDSQLKAFNEEATALTPGAVIQGPFSDQDGDAYARWRDLKLEQFPKSPGDIYVELKNPLSPTAVELAAIHLAVQRSGMCIYKGPADEDVDRSKATLRELGTKLGLIRMDQNPYADADAITPLHVAAGETGKGRKLYIPYTNRSINWHTDGYYNPQSRRIRAMALHCVRAAGGGGGANQLFDPEMAYILMREQDPEMLAAFCRLDAMTIPGNDVDADVSRRDVTGPVFSLNKADGSLYMRYTARQRHIIWASDGATSRGVQFMKDLLKPDGIGAKYTFTHRLEPGEGLICNNVLHTRTAFENNSDKDGQRMILRARYLDRI